MIAIDIALLVGGGAVVVVLAALVGGRFGARGEARRRRRQGQRNAEAEKRRLAETCVVCGASVDPALDVWDEEKWWHRQCYREAVR
jgi:hypothetical protein